MITHEDGAPQQRGPRARHRSRATTADAVMVGLIAFGAAVAVTVGADAAPTGGEVADALMRSGLAVATVLAAARARRRTLVAAATLVAIGSGGWNVVIGAVALVIVLVLALRDVRSRAAGAVVGAMVSWCALQLVWPETTGASALLAVAAVVPLWWSGYRVSRTATRRRVRVVATALVAVTVLGLVGAAVIVATQQQRIRDAADDTARAARQVGAGRSDDGAERFRTGAAEFRSIAAMVDAPWMLPARNVPGLGPNVRAIGRAAGAGAALTDTAAVLADDVDLEALQLDDGSIDLEQLQEFRVPLATAASAIDDADHVLSEQTSPWILGPLEHELTRLRGDVSDAAAAALLAERAAVELPALLGADGPRRYLLLLGNPAEARDLGGHLGSWAELVADNGKLETVEVGEAYDLFSPSSTDRPELRVSALPAALRELSPTRFPQNWGGSPDLATVGRLAADLYPQVRPGAPLDGVMYADPEAFAALLSFTGPVEHRGIQIDEESAVDYLTAGQFEGEEVPLRDMVRAALDRFTDSRLPPPDQLADAFHSVVAEGRLQFVALEDGRRSPNDLLTLSGLDVPLVDDRRDPAIDVLSVVNRNANPSKIDAHLGRAVDYVVEPLDGGGLGAAVVVTMENRAPASGAPDVVIGCGRDCPRPPGTNRTELSVLTPHELVGVEVDGEERSARTRTETDGLRRHGLTIDIPPGATRTVVVELRGTLGTAEDYRLDWYRQPLVIDEELRLLWRDAPLEVGPNRWNRITVRDGG